MKKLIILGLLAMLAPFAAAQEVTINVQSVTLPSPASDTTAYLDVTFVGSSTSELAGYNLVLNLSPANGNVTFVNATNTSPSPFSFFNVVASDYQLQITGLADSGDEDLIADGDGLVRIEFEVLANTIGVFDVTVDTDLTLLSDPLANPIAYDVDNGTITLTGDGQVIPLPAAFYAGLVGLGAVGVATRRLRRGQPIA